MFLSAQYNVKKIFLSFVELSLIKPSEKIYTTTGYDYSSVKT